MSQRDPGPIPNRWLRCPRKATGLVADKFMAFKTPLGSQFNDKVPEENRFTPSMLFVYMKSMKIQLGLWIDLTNTSRFYNKAEVEEAGCKYVKMQCRGHGETPSPEQTREFINLVARFISQKPLEFIGVHCTHGFNRTGFLLVSYMVEHLDCSVQAAINEFARMRPPGIYKQDYLQELFRRYDEIELTPAAPALPDWCHEEEEDFDDDVPSNSTNTSTSNPRKHKGKGRRETTHKKATFMPGVRGVEPFDTQPRLSEVQKKAQQFLFGLRFPHRKDLRRHLKNTLLDGEMVIDKVDNKDIPRYLCYDVISFEGTDTGRMEFYPTRLSYIENEIVNPRHQAMKEGKIKKEQEPFSIRLKQFWELPMARQLLGEKFAKTLSHEPDGLIFQPSKERYIAGPCEDVLKWKPSHMNSVDFKLKIVTQGGQGILPTKVGYLYVGKMDQPFASMKVTKDIKHLDNKIIECTFENGRWVFMRERTDKSFPNSFNTASSVCESIKDPVTKEILLDYIDNHRFHDDSDMMPPPKRMRR
ncbi:hypothetical protein B5X24_HaOG208020 [Helicoverpa armigera]|nr:hypothetical protein B5X24_HaOG208020 [Helicoverpa armigera]